GAGAAGESPCGALLLLARAGPAGAGRGRRGPRSALRLGRVLRVAAVRRAAVGERVEAERGRVRPPRAGGGGRGAEGSIRRGRRAPPGDLGRLLGRTRRVRVLAAPRGPAARPLPLPARRGHLGDRAALAVT